MKSLSRSKKREGFMGMFLRDSRGVLGLDTVRAVMIAFLTLAVIGVAILLALVSLQDSNIFTPNSQAANDSDSIISNVSSGLTSFFSSTGTIFSILVVVVIILAITIIIVAVGRFGGGARGGL